MQNIIKLRINKTKSKTNYIPSLPLNKIIELSEGTGKTWHYERKTNELHLITNKAEQQSDK